MISCIDSGKYSCGILKWSVVRARCLPRYLVCEVAYIRILMVICFS